MLTSLYRDITAKARFESFPIHVTGYILTAEAAVMGLCFLVFGCEGHAAPLTALVLTMFALGSVGVFLFKSDDKVAPVKGIITMALGFLALCVFGAVPYMIFGFGAVESLFESISGFTTTGLTSVSDVTSLPDPVLVWRALTGWSGGITFICLFSLFLTSFGLGGRFLLSTDITNDSKEFTNRIKTLAFRFVGIYAVCTGVLALILLICGNGFIPSICLAMSTISTTGFAVANDEVASLSMISKVFIGLFMVIGSTNFLTTYTAILKRSLRPYKEDTELKYLLAWFVFMIAVLFLFLLRAGYPLNSTGDVIDTILYALSVGTTTGFVFHAGDFPLAAVLFLCIASLIGGCADSASGGVKISRMILTLKMVLATIKNVIYPNAVLSVKYHKKPVRNEVVYMSMVIIMLFLITIVAGAAAIYAFNIGFGDSLILSISSVTTVGSGLFSLASVEINTGLMAVMCILMWIGRFEVILVLIMFTPSFWRNYIMNGVRDLRKKGYGRRR